MNFNFIASNTIDLNSFKDIEKFIANYPDFQTVILNDEKELSLLLELMGITNTASKDLNGSEFSKYWDLSTFKLPELNEKQFTIFYEKWIQNSKRNNNMDEYGNLIFLQGLSSKWNNLKYRLVVKDND